MGLSSLWPDRSKKGVIAGNESLICSNPECGKEITDIKKVLRPNGFSVDFYDQPNNDVTAQKYIFQFKNLGWVYLRM